MGRTKTNQTCKIGVTYNCMDEQKRGNIETCTAVIFHSDFHDILRCTCAIECVRVCVSVSFVRSSFGFYSHSPSK